MLQVLDKAMLAKADMAQQVLTLLLLVMRMQWLHAALLEEDPELCCSRNMQELLLSTTGPACAYSAHHA